MIIIRLCKHSWQLYFLPRHDDNMYFPFRHPEMCCKLCDKITSAGLMQSMQETNKKKKKNKRMEQQTMAKWNVPEKNKNDEKF